MIPYQKLVNKKNQPLVFLTWIAAKDIPAEEFKAQDESLTQLLATFFYLSGTHGLRLAETSLDRFQKTARQKGRTLVRIPRIFFPCADPGRAEYLAFDWNRWLGEAGYLLEP